MSEQPGSRPGDLREDPIGAMLGILRRSGVDREVLWSIAPSVETSLLSGGRASSGEEAHRSARIKRLIRDYAAGLRRASLAGAARVGDVVFAWDTLNQRRVLQPVVDMMSSDSSIRSTPWRMLPKRAAERPGESYASDGGEFPDAIDQAFADPPSLDRLIQRGVDSLHFAERVMTGSSAVVVSSQQGVLARSFASIARQAGVPSVYLPHAPMADVPWYRDIPFGVVGLRGEGEVDFVTNLSGGSIWARAVGNPSVAEVGEVLPRLAASNIVLALSPVSDEVLEESVGMFTSIGERPMVAPHPRQSKRHLRRLIPPEWEITSYRTTDELLGTGPGVLVQRGSGVGLEALRRGIPVIDIRTGGNAPPYLYLRDPQIPTAGSDLEMSEALAEAREIAGDHARRAPLRDLARYWNGVCGTKATRNIVELVASVSDATDRPLQPIVDRWKTLRSA